MKRYTIPIIVFLLTVLTFSLMFSSRLLANYMIKSDLSKKIYLDFRYPGKLDSSLSAQYIMGDLSVKENVRSLAYVNMPASLDTAIKRKVPTSTGKRKVRKESVGTGEEETSETEEASFVESCMADCLMSILEGIGEAMCDAIFGGNGNEGVVTTETHVEVTKSVEIKKPPKPIRKLPYSGVIKATRRGINSVPILAYPVRKNGIRIEVGVVPIGVEVEVSRVEFVDGVLWAKVVVHDSTRTEGWIEEKYIVPISKTEPELEKKQEEQHQGKSTEKQKLGVEVKKESEGVIIKDLEFAPKPIVKTESKSEGLPDEEFKEKSILRVKEKNVSNTVSVEDSAEKPLGRNVFLSVSYPYFSGTSLYDEYNKSKKFLMNLNLGTKIPIYGLFSLGLDIGYCFANGTPQDYYEYGANMKDCPFNSDLNIFYFGPAFGVGFRTNEMLEFYVGIGPVYSNVKEKAEIDVYKGDIKIGSRVDEINRWRFGLQTLISYGAFNNSIRCGLELRMVILSWKSYEQKSLTLDFLDRDIIGFYSLGFYFGYSF